MIFCSTNTTIRRSYAPLEDGLQGDYIHLNALDLSMPQWREGKIADTTQALEYLRTYRWSSHLDYLSEKNFPSVTEREFLASAIGTRAHYEQEIRHIISDANLATASLTLE